MSSEKLLEENLLDTEVVNEKPHWFWGSWVLLALAATCCFMVCNLIISSLSHLGLEAIFYFNGGATIYALAYFYIQSKRVHKRRVLLYTDNKFDWSLFMCYIVGAGIGCSIFFAIAFTFKFCARAGLNIGIA